MLTKKDFLKIALKQDGNYFDNSTNHIRNIQKTENYILLNKKSDYTVLLPNNPTERETLAAEELCDFFEEGTGVRLRVLTDSREDFSFSNRYISIGETKLVSQYGLELPKQELGAQGYVIKTFEKNILLVGGTDFGSLYAVYDLLENILGYDYFNPDTYALNKGVNEISLMDYDIKEISDIGAFSRNYGTFGKIKAKNVLNRYRMTEREDTVMALEGSTSVHNMMMFLPYKEFGEVHPLWFSDFKENLCLTAHGDEDEYKLLVQTVVEKIKKEFISGAKGNVMFFGQSDGAPACDCPICKANKERYGSDTGSCILFLNDVLDEIYNWFETKAGKPYKRDFYISILAYLAFEFAPVTYDEEREEFSVNGGLRIHEKLGFISAPIKYDYGALSTAQSNIPYYRNILAWGATTNKSMFYTYDFNTRYYFCPNETLVSKQELYRLMAGLKCIFLYDQGQWTNEGLPTGFAMMKIYISNKLRWNVNVNVNELVEKYFKGVYGPAGDTMLNLYWSFREYWADRRARAEKGEFNPRYVNYSACLLGEHELWEFPKLVEWQKAYEKALEEIQVLKTIDERVYELAYRNVIAERVSVTYLQLLNYSNRYTFERLQEMRLQFKNDTNLIKLERLKEAFESWDGRHSLVSEVLEDWGI